jgi:hypothetical protein
MRTSAFVIAIVAAVALASPASKALAQGKGTEGTPSAAPSDTPSVRPSDQPSDRPGGAAGAIPGGRNTRSEPPPSVTEPPPAVTEEPPAPERWNSAAAAIWHVRGQVKVAIGYSGTRSSADDAKASAIEACKSAGGQGCKAIGAWNAGCLYITTGHTTKRAGWASGASSDAATQKCKGDGFTCKPPIGGCLD